MPSPSDDNRHWEFTDHPMIKVSWPEAKAYCEWIGGRLPTGDEWERAARGGTDTRYPWGDEIRPNQAKYFKSPGKSGAVTAPVKSYDPNAYGLFDVSGNVWEWTSDLGAKGVHQTRGGSWYSPAKDLHVTSVRTFKSDEGVNEVGFRCLLPQLPKGASEGN
jgi:formylglycine-generating enzyme required for sulfatase activity